MSDEKIPFSDAEDEDGVSDLYVYKGDMSAEEYSELQEKLIAEHKKQLEDEKVAHVQLGACNCCGQVFYIDKICETPDEADAAATARCDCPGATAERRITKQVTDGNQLIYRIFGDDSENMGFEPVKDAEIFTFLTSVVEMTARGFISSSTINIRGLCRAKISLTSKEKIKVERVESKSYQLEE